METFRSQPGDLHVNTFNIEKAINDVFKPIFDNKMVKDNPSDSANLGLEVNNIDYRTMQRDVKAQVPVPPTVPSVPW